MSQVPDLVLACPNLENNNHDVRKLNLSVPAAHAGVITLHCGLLVVKLVILGKEWR